MKLFWHLTLCLLLPFSACNNDGASSEKIVSYPKVISKCDNEALYLTVPEVYSLHFDIEAFLMDEDSLEYEGACPRSRDQIPPEDSLGLLLLERPFPERIVWKAQKERYHPMDTFALLLDTAHVVSTFKPFLFWPQQDENPTPKLFTRAYPLFIKNLSPDTVRVFESLGIELQVQMQTGTWQRAIWSDVMCATGMIDYWLSPGESILTLVPITDGTRTTTFRITRGAVVTPVFNRKSNFQY